jgi:hypothetical protein|tara:strand:- start:1296 stop:3275 length:1980 start_codon:yes stop_codon:yes gene_type:complete
MPGVTYDHYFKTQIAKAFVDQFTSFSEDKYYLCLSGIDAVTSDARTERNELDVRKNILLSKRIDQNSASLLLPRYDWTEGISMDAISDTVDVSGFTNPFYVYSPTSQNVYVCLNNNQNNNGSNIEPNGTSTDILELTDGFAWKFLYTVPTESLGIFRDDNYIPVKTLPFYENIANAYEDTNQNQYEVQYEANLDDDGSVVGVSVSTTGKAAKFVNGVAQSTAAFVVSVINDADNAKVTLSGYDESLDATNYSIRFVSGIASGIVRQISSINGSVFTLSESLPSNRVPAPGDLYEIGPELTITGNGSGAKAFVKLDQIKEIDRVIVYDNGSNYSTASASLVTGIIPDLSETYSFNPLVFDPIGKNAASELASRHAAIGVQIDPAASPAEATALGNDFVNIAIWKNPSFAQGTVNAGDLAGSDDVRKTTVLVSEPSSDKTLEDAGFRDTTKEYLVIGNSSGIVCKLDGVLTLDRNSKVSGQVIAKDLSKSFQNEEILTVMSRAKGSSDAYTEEARTLRVFQTRFGDTELSIGQTAFRNTFRFTARSESNLKTEGKLDGNVVNRTTNTSGNLVSVQDLGGDLYQIDITNVSVGDGTTYGYSDGDNGRLTAVDDSQLTFTDVQDVTLPELNPNSGELIYIKGLGEAIQRSSEQTELFKFIFAF